MVALICSSMLSEKTPWTISGSLFVQLRQLATGRTRRGLYLALGVDALVIAVGSSAKRGAGSIAAGDAAALREVFLTLRLADFRDLRCSSRRRRSSSGLKTPLALKALRRCSGMYLSAMAGWKQAVWDFGRVWTTKRSRRELIAEPDRG